MFVRPKMGYVRAKIGLTGQFDRRQPGNYLQPWGIQDGKPVFLSMYCGPTKVGLGKERVNPLSPKINIQILQIDLHTFLLRIVERIWFKIKVSHW